MKDKLLPCKCGNNPDIISSQGDNNKWYVLCKKCFSVLPYKNNVLFTSKQKAIEAWNI